MDDLISVVIPAYNASKFIDSAIQSVLNQTYKNVEIIVVDDRSTDDTLDKLREYKDKIHIFQNEMNKGTAITRNTGIGHCRGNLIAFLDQDDKWVPDKLEVFANMFSRSNDVLFGFSDFSRFNWVDGAFFALSNSQTFPIIYECFQRQKYSDRKCFTIRKKDFFAILLRGYPIYSSAIVVRKRIFDSIGIWRKVRTNEDFDFALRSCRVTDCIYIDEPLTMIGRHDANLSIDISKQLENDLSVFDLHLADTNYKKEEMDMINYYKGRRLCSLGYSYFLSGNNKKAIKRYAEALGNRKWFWHALLRISYLVLYGGNRKRNTHNEIS